MFLDISFVGFLQNDQHFSQDVSTHYTFVDGDESKTSEEAGSEKPADATVSGGIPAIDTKRRWICFKIGERLAPCHPVNISKIHRRARLHFREIWCEASLEGWMRKETIRIEIS